MADLKDGEVHLMQGSGCKPYELKNVGGVYSCSCPAWRNQSVAIEKRTCKHMQAPRRCGGGGAAGCDAERAAARQIVQIRRQRPPARCPGPPRGSLGWKARSGRLVD